MSRFASGLPEGGARLNVFLRAVWTRASRGAKNTLDHERRNALL
jgi:hypothetical protein